MSSLCYQALASAADDFDRLVALVSARLTHSRSSPLIQRIQWSGMSKAVSAHWTVGPSDTRQPRNLALGTDAQGQIWLEVVGPGVTTPGRICLNSPEALASLDRLLPCGAEVQ